MTSLVLSKSIVNILLVQSKSPVMRASMSHLVHVKLFIVSVETPWCACVCLSVSGSS